MDGLRRAREYAKVAGPKSPLFAAKPAIAATASRLTAACAMSNTGLRFPPCRRRRYLICTPRPSWVSLWAIRVKDTSSVAMNSIIKFTTLFGLLAVEISVAMQEGGQTGLKLGIVISLFVVALLFVYRSFYGMRILEEK